MPFTVTKTVNDWLFFIERVEKEYYLEGELLLNIADSIYSNINYKAVHTEVTIEFNDTERAALDDLLGANWR